MGYDEDKAWLLLNRLEMAAGDLIGDGRLVEQLVGGARNVIHREGGQQGRGKTVVKRAIKNPAWWPGLNYLKDLTR